MQERTIAVSSFLPNPWHTDTCAADVASFGCPKADCHLLWLAQSEVNKPIIHHGSASCDTFRARYSEHNARNVAPLVLSKDTGSNGVLPRFEENPLPYQHAWLGWFVAQVFQVNLRIAEAVTNIEFVDHMTATRVLLRLPPFGQRRLIALPRILDVVGLQGIAVLLLLKPQFVSRQSTVPLCRQRLKLCIGLSLAHQEEAEVVGHGEAGTSEVSV